MSLGRFRVKRKPNDPEHSSDYEVGYKRPPQHSRFKVGQSGNPRGRPKGSRNFATDVKRTLKAGVKVSKEGKAKRISTQEAALMRLRERALAGEVRALDRLLSLAQAFNNEDVVVQGPLSTDDAAAIENFAKRVLSGAVGAIPEEDSDQDEGDAPA